MCQAILAVDNRKKIAYRNPDFFICYGDPIEVSDGQARGNQTLFSFDSPRTFLAGLCESKLRLSVREQGLVLAEYRKQFKQQ